MWKRRLGFNAIFFIGTIIAIFGWMGELRGWPQASNPFLAFGNFAIAGHILQIIGIFGSLITPDAKEEKKDFE
jgi:hypothetical protein